MFTVAVAAVEPNVAVIVPDVDAVMLNVVALKDTELCPAGISSIAGADMAVDVLVSETTIPLVGALPESNMRPKMLFPAATVVDDRRRPVMPGKMVKSPGLDVFPAGAVRVIGPVVAAAGTVAVIELSLLTANEEAGAPLNDTAVTAVSAAPEMAITSPG